MRWWQWVLVGVAAFDLGLVTVMLIGGCRRLRDENWDGS
jgi:hypothetical protein